MRVEVVTGRADALPRGWACFGLTTEDRPERRAHLRREFERAGFAAQLHVARRPDDAGGFRSAGSRGCVEGHLACLRAAHERGVEVCVIAEDDVMLAARAPRLMREIARQVADITWSTLYLGYLPGSPVGRQAVHRVSRHLVRSDGWEVLGAHFVAVRHDALPALIADFEQRFLPGGNRIDSDGIHNEFRRDHHLDTLLSVPNLAIQGPSPSGISDASSWRTELLHRDAVRRAVEVPKRAILSLAASLPPDLAVSRWNRRASRAT